jgi:hypothetical protein
MRITELIMEYSTGEQLITEYSPFAHSRPSRASGGTARCHTPL